MFTSIKTSKKNKEVVTSLTNKLGLGVENVVARLALTYSLSSDRKMDLMEIEDSGGKEYSKKVLFGEYEDVYVAMVAVHYDLYKTDENIGKYIKMHIDDGLEKLDEEYGQTNNISGLEFLMQKIK